MFRIQIDTDNDAFREHRADAIAQVLRELTDHLTLHGFPSSPWRKTLMDINGNSCGTATYEAEDEDEDEDEDEPEDPDADEDSDDPGRCRSCGALNGDCDASDDCPACRNW